MVIIDIKNNWFRPETEKVRLTLHKRQCPERGLNINLGKAGNPLLRHHICETAAGHPVFLIPGDDYIAKGK